MRVVRAYRQEAAEIARFDRANREYLERNRQADPAAGHVLPEHVVLPGPRRAAGAVARQPRGDPRPHHDWRLRRVQRLPRDAVVADDRLRLGDEHGAARPRVVAAHARGAGPRAGDRGSAARTGWCTLHGVRGEVEFRNLSRSPTASAPVLDGISVRIEPGQTVALGRADRIGQVHADQPAAAAASTRRRAPCSSTAWTCGTCRSRSCAAPSGSCRRSRSCSRNRSPRTSPSARAGSGRRRTSERRPVGGRRGASRQGRGVVPRRATTRWWASAASRCRAARSSARPWRAR